MTFPGRAVFATLRGATLFGAALRDTLDPRLRTRARAPRGRFRRTLKETS